jgi:1-pyrroline-5-carboxylate dehydrogenase
VVLCKTTDDIVSGAPAFEKITGYIEKAKKAGGEILIGGTSDGSKGYFIHPTVIQSKDPLSVTMVEEIFGPVLTVTKYTSVRKHTLLTMTPLGVCL